MLNGANLNGANLLGAIRYIKTTYRCAHIPYIKCRYSKPFPLRL